MIDPFHLVPVDFSDACKLVPQGCGVFYSDLFILHEDKRPTIGPMDWETKVAIDEGTSYETHVLLTDAGLIYYETRKGKAGFCLVPWHGVHANKENLSIPFRWILEPKPIAVDRPKQRESRRDTVLLLAMPRIIVARERIFDEVPTFQKTVDVDKYWDITTDIKADFYELVEDKDPQYELIHYYCGLINRIENCSPADRGFCKNCGARFMSEEQAHCVFCKRPRGY